MLSLLASLALAQTFDEPSTWHLESSVELPAIMWVAATLNTEARMVAWDLQLVLDCPAGEKSGRATEVRCEIADAAIQGAPHPGDTGRLGKILGEIDEKLTGAEVVLRVGPRGDLRSVQLEGIRTLRRRDTAMRENMRLMVSRAVAGFDQPIPDRDVEAGWPQKGSWIAQLPAGAGTLAGGKVIHQRVAEDEDTWRLATAGRVTLEPHSQWDQPPIGQTRLVQRQEGPLHPASWGSWAESIGMVAMFDTEIEAAALVDAESRALVERSWVAEGTPTPSSRVSTGAEGYAYFQEGTLRRLDPNEDRPELPATEEVAADGPTPSALQTWEALGVDW